MDPFLFCLCGGFGGLLLMVALGLGHHQTAHGRGAHDHAAPAHGGVHHGHHGHAGHARAGKMPPAKTTAHGKGADAHPHVGLLLLGLFSPLTVCNFLLGFGAAGLLLRQMTSWPAALLVALAALGGIGFQLLVFRPVWRLLFGFASRPARTLETVEFEEGEAATDFDSAGHGLVVLELDGQVRQVLGTLAEDERSPGAPRIRTGERLFIRSVDHRRNTCTVARLGC